MLNPIHLVLVSSLIAAAPAAGQAVPPDYGFDFVTIGDAGNESWMGTYIGGLLNNPGSVGYEYRIASLETRTSQFVEFMNVLGSLAPDTALIAIPSSWGAGGSVLPDGTVRFTQFSEASGEWPVAGISWRVAAIYTNWLHNDKAATLDALNNGAYDTSTFMTDPSSPPNLLDQATRNPDAKYWIPSIDEWLKAAHYDPNKHGPGAGGWWDFPNGTDDPLTPGLPGEPGAQTSYQLNDPALNELTIPVGAYPNTLSPWSLLDVSGGATEWTETYVPDVFQLSRF